MIINNAPQNEAVLSNVGQIGEFRIRNSAKAFSILSSGLYSNKIKAIIRELSCNAVDSHAAAGKKDMPFDLHLPTRFEPWFAIRDYGTGLNHEQVTNIYTTYFESTKTASNDFIGALGLGSKSPFAYTDNFTVTAVKDGRKGIYTAFINEHGVPSIALMMEEDTTDPAGVEVKFSVNDHYDYDSFRHEARSVYRYFKLRPNVNDEAFKFDDTIYESENIIPGVHTVKNARYGESVAVMGNIAYPIQIPQSNMKDLGECYRMIECGLEMHFDIGELDFQASREGLSYIPQTVEAIRKKLEATNAQLSTYIAEEAEKIENPWERAFFLMERSRNRLWSSAVVKYAKDNNFPLIKTNHSIGEIARIDVGITALSRRYNINISAFSKSAHYTTCNTMSPTTRVKYNTNHVQYGKKIPVWNFQPSSSTLFIINDTKRGAVERAKNYCRTERSNIHSTIYVLSPVDADKPMKLDKFFQLLHNPPESYRMKASQLPEKERKTAKTLGKNVTILAMTEKRTSSWRSDYTWSDAGTADSFDKNTKRYYLPLSGYTVLSTIDKEIDAKFLQTALRRSGLKEFAGLTVYGVRKGDMEYIQTQPNWINLETHIANVLSKLDDKLMMGFVLSKLDRDEHLKYNETLTKMISNTDSPYLKFISQFEGFEKVETDWNMFQHLVKTYANGANFDPSALIQKIMDERSAVYKRYKLLDSLNYRVTNEDIAEYINMVDTAKGI